MASPASLRARKDAVVAQYHENAALVRDVQRQAVEELLPTLRDELDLDEEAVGAGKALLQDRVSVFRFCRRARFSPSAALDLLDATLRWRLTSSIRSLSPSSLPPAYLANPLLFFHPSLADRFGRPCAILNLRHVQRAPDGGLDGLKDLVRLTWEMGRRYLTDLSRTADDKADPKLQMVVIVDLDGAGMANLEVELLPFFMDLLKNHFPGMVGGVFILNYGFVYAGMWQLAKRVLPKTALDRILFPSKAELLEFFEEDHLLVEHGGTVKYEYSPANPILEKYGPLSQPPSRPSSAYPSPLPSPSASTASLRSDVFHSVLNSRPGTPSAAHRPSGLLMTPARSSGGTGWPWGWGSSARQRYEPESGGGLRRVRSLAELQKKLEQTQREIEEDESTTESTTTSEDEGTEGSVLRAGSVAASARSSRFSSRATSRATSRAVSREASPARRRKLEPLSTTSTWKEASRPHEHHVLSPYNASNPHFGYPAYVPPSSLDPRFVPRPHHFRRRKRDLLRTLTYLAALRFLALHRAIRYRLNLLVAMLVRVAGFGWLRSRKATASAVPAVPGASGDRKVHWASSAEGSSSTSASSSSSSLSAIVPPQPHTHHHVRPPSPRSSLAPSPLFDVDPTYVYLTLLFLIIRTPHRREKLRRLVRFLAVGGPAWALSGVRRGMLVLLLGKEAARGALREERAKKL
ncbi:hypothetical protein JCM8547_009155 [Rhodosporidiobolus lusitaniae]